MPPVKRKVLFLCVHNSARSQMAEGLLNHLFGDRFVAYSAGLTPTKVNPYAIKVMAEIGIDILDNKAKSFIEFIGKGIEVVVTVCDESKEMCPHFPGAKRFIYWNFQDPSEVVGTEEEILKVFRNVRDALRDQITKAVEKSEL
ncbi:MAG: arsenate reductase ArsC [Nitrososphaeria archaeon]|jgi:arsenate reductase